MPTIADLKKLTNQDEFNRAVTAALADLYLCIATAEAYHDEKFRVHLAELTDYVTANDESPPPVLEAIYAIPEE